MVIEILKRTKDLVNTNYYDLTTSIRNRNLINREYIVSLSKTKSRLVWVKFKYRKVQIWTSKSFLVVVLKLSLSG